MHSRGGQCTRNFIGDDLSLRTDDPTPALGDRMTVCGVDLPSERPNDASNEGPFMADCIRK